MKPAIILIIIAILVTATYFLAQPKDTSLQDAKTFIENEKRKLRDDSITFDRRMQIEIAEEELKQAQKR